MGFPPSGGGGAIVNQGVQGNNSGNFTTNSGTFTDVGLSATVAAAVGDLLACTMTGSWSVNATGSGFNQYFQLITTTGGHVVCVGVYNEALSGGRNCVAIQGIYAVVAGDLSGGNVAVKLQFATDTGTVTLNNTGGNVPSISIVNLKH